MKIIKLLLYLILNLLSSCQSYWATDFDFGSSVNIAIQEQKANSNAVIKSPSQIRGMDGVSAKATIDSYQNSFIRSSPVVNSSPSSIPGILTGGQSSSSTGASSVSIPTE